VMIEDALQGLSSAQREQLVGSLEAIRANLNNVQEGKEAANG